ncbi:hypothetical protein Tco_0290237 [Tanacetum coccineum]
MDLLSFIQTVDPTKVRVGKRQRAEDEPRLLDSTVGRVVPLLPIAPARAKSELDASVDKLFDEGGNGNQADQGNSASGGHGVGIQLVSEAAETVVEDAAPVQPRRQRKRKTIVSDAGEPSHPPKKLKEDHETLSGVVACWSCNAEVRGEPIPTLPFVTSSVSTTPECEDEDHTDSATGLDLRTIDAPPRFVISSDSSHHSSVNIAEAEVDSFARPFVPLMIMATTVTSTVDPATTVKEKFVETSVFGGDSSGGEADHTAGGFSDLTGSDFIVGGISPDTNLQKVYVPQWSVTNGSRLDDGHTCREMVDEFAPPKFFASICGMEHDQFFTELNVGVARQMSLSAEEAEAPEAIRLRAEASKFEVAERSLRDEMKVLKEQNAALEQEKIDLSVKVADLAASVKVREQEVVDLDAQVTFAKSQMWHELRHRSAGLQEKVMAYEGFIDQLEKFQDEKIKEEGLSARITHGAEGRKLTDVAAYNPSAEADYLSALQRLQSVNFSLITELRANKDASIDTIMNLLRLEDTLAERLGLTKSQPHVNQLMVPIHHSPDQRIIGMESTSGGAPGTVDTNTALSIVVVSTNIVWPIFIDDYEVISEDDQATADGNVADKDANPFPNVDDAALNVSELLFHLLLLIC